MNCTKLPVSRWRVFASLVLKSTAVSCLLAPISLLSAHADSSELWESYTKTPDTHPNIANCSFAGYMYGEAPLPDIEGPVYRVTDFGAKGDGQADDTEAVRAALAAVGEEGGVVYFPDGRYLLSGVLFVHTNNTVLRGQSEAGVELVFTQPLDRGYATFFYTTGRGEIASRWTYSGGLIWFGPLSQGNTYRSAPPDSPIQRGEFAERWNTVDLVGRVAEPAMRGDYSITLDGAAELEAGQYIYLTMKDPGDYSMVKHLSGDGDWAEAFDWENGPRGAAWPNPGDMGWVVEVTEIEGTKVTLKQPLRFDIRPEWQPVVETLAPLLEGSGMEEMTLVFERDYTWTYAMHHREEGWNGPYFNNAIHCWLRNVTMVDVDNGPNLSCAKNITLTGFTIKASGPETMEHHHGTITRNRSHDNLFSDFRIESKPWHGLNVESFSSGNVWSRGIAEHGTFDSHRKMPFDGIRTEITLVTNDGTHGGSGGPLMGARFANWNIATPNGRNYIVGWANATPAGVIVGLQGSEPAWDAQSDRCPTGEVSACIVLETGTVPEIRNLYEAQLALRLGSDKTSLNSEAR